jgi:hypothetical protein
VRRALHLAIPVALLAFTAVAFGSSKARPSDVSDFRCRGAIATMVGTAGDDVLVGTRHDDVIVARAGNDVVRAGRGDDKVCDNDGNDHVILGPGDDEAGGGRGSDRVDGGGGDDWLAGRYGNDQLNGGAGNDRLVGEIGNDSLRGNSGNDNIGGGPGTDDCLGGPGRDKIRTCETGETHENRAPVAVDDTETTSEIMPKDLGVLANDSDADGDPLRVASVSTAATTGTVTITGGGRGIRYDPGNHFSALAPGESATDTFTYTLSGTTGAARVASGTPTATVTVTIAGVDTGPSAVRDNRTVGEDPDAPQLVDVLGNDTDPDGGVAATIASVTQPLNGTVGITGGGTALTYKPSPDYCNSFALASTDNFNYTLAPGGSTAQVAVTVTCANDGPLLTASAGTAAFVEDAGPVQADPTLDLIDVDSANLSGATVAITGNFHSAEDSLDATDEPGITHSYDSGTGVLTLTGTASVTDYQLVLRSITYSNSSNTPATAARTMSFTATDSSSEPSNTVTRDVSVAPANDAPVAGTTVGSTSYTENAAGAVIDSLATAADPDDTNIESATVRISSGFDTGDVLEYTDQPPISGTWNSGTHTMTLTGSATVAAYQAAIRTVKFRSANDNPALSKTAEFKLNDGDANSNAPTKTIAVTRANDAPTLATTSAALPYGENAGPVSVDTGLTITDPDSTEIQGAVVKINSGFVAVEDELGPTGSGTITKTYDDTNGTLTLNGTATLAAYQAALRSVTYDNNSNTPTTPRSVTFEATDAEGDASNVPSRTINISAANDSAVVTTSIGSTGYTEGAAAVVIDNALTVADPDDTNIEGATVTISGGPNPGDSLEFVDQPGITGSGSGTQTLTLSGSRPLADYQAALRTVKFVTTNDDPSATKTIEFKADDGNGNGNGASKTIAVTRVNDGPAINTTGAVLSYEEGDGATAADGGLTLTDPDSTQIQGATVQITVGHVQSEDDLAFTDTAAITGAYDDATGKLTLSGTTSVANYETALKSVTYSNGSSTPTVSTRTVSFQATDAEGDASNTATRDISVGPVNDAPTVTTSSGPTAYAEADPATQIDDGVTVDDVDDTNIESAVVKVSTGFDAGDLLELADQAGITDSYDPATGILTLLGSKPLADYQTALRAITFRSTSDDPAASKAIQFKVNDGDLDSAAATKAITVTTSNDGPTITTAGTNLAYAENDGAKVIDSALTLTEDSTEVASAQVWVNTPDFDSAQDSLAFTDQLGITGTYHSATGVLDLSGTTTPANYQTALRSVTYENTSDGPAPLSRTISFQATDGLATAGNIATRTIVITAANDAPTAVDDTGTTDEDTTINASAPGVLGNDTDPDPGDLKKVTKLNGSSLTAGAATGSSDDGATVTINDDGSYTYNPGSLYQGLLTGDTDTDFFTYTMEDTAGSPSTATVNITINGVSDAPTATADSFDAIGNTALYVGLAKPAGSAAKEISGSVLANDTDPDTPAGSLNVEPITDGATTQGGTVTVESSGQFSYQPPAGVTGVGDTFTYRVCDTGPPCTSTTVANSTGTVTLPLQGQVWYVKNDSAAGGDGTSDGPFDTLAEAETASGSNDTTYVYDGDNTSTGLDSGYALNSGERLIGEAAALSVDPDQGGPQGTVSLRGAVAGAYPTLTANNEDVVALDAGNEVRGIQLDPQGTGGGIAGAAGDTGGGTIDDVRIIDAGTAGTEPGLDLDSTTGSFNVSDLTVDNTAATGQTSGSKGVRLNGAGTVNFASAGTISIKTAGAAGLDADTTNMGAGSVFDDITVTASGSGGVRLFNTTGTTTLGNGSGSDLGLTTTSGGTAALLFSNAGTVSVPGAGTANISATGGPAVDISGTAGVALDLDTVSSSNSATTGISLAGLGTGTFAASGGSIGGSTGTAFNLNGGSGTVTYPGTFNNGAGQTASITNRSGGAVSFSGAINDTNDQGGGIALSTNSGGSTTFSNGTKTINTTTSGSPAQNNAITMLASDGHTLSLTGGGLDIDSAGRGLQADTSGTLNVTGSGNSINSVSGVALDVANTDIGASDLTFERIDAGNATAAADPANGIVLNNTGSAGELTVTSSGAGTCTAADTSGCSGGLIQNTAGADDAGSVPAGTGILLKDTGGLSLTRMRVANNSNYGIRGTNVNGFTLANSVINGVNGTSAVTANKDSSAKFEQLTGTVSVTDTQMSGGFTSNLLVSNTSGTLNATLTNFTSGTIDATGGDDAVQFEGVGTSTLNATVSSSTFTTATGDLFQFIGNGTGGGALSFTGNTVSNDDPSIATGGGGITLSGAAEGPETITFSDNTLRDSHTAALTINKSRDGTGPDKAQTVIIDNNTIGVTGVANSGSLEGSGISVTNFGDGDQTLTVTNNRVRQYNSTGMRFVAGAGLAENGQMNLNISGNTILEPGTNPSVTLLQGIRVESGVTAGDTFQTCANFGANDMHPSGDPALSGGASDYRLVVSQSTTLRLPGYGGGATDGAAVATFVNGKIGSGATGTAVAAAPGVFSGTGTTCP